MELFTVRKAIAILILALLHAALSFGIFLLAFGRGMSRFDTGNSPTVLERVLDAAALVLYFPFMHLAQLAPKGWFSGLWGYFPLLINSSLWAVVLVCVYCLLRGRRHNSFENEPPAASACFRR
jgi:hypothetical protein